MCCINLERNHLHAELGHDRRSRVNLAFESVGSLHLHGAASGGRSREIKGLTELPALRLPSHRKANIDRRWDECGCLLQIRMPIKLICKQRVFSQIERKLILQNTRGGIDKRQ